MQCEPYGTTHCNSFNDAAATAAAAAAAAASVPSSSSSSSSSSASESAHQGNTNQFDVTLDTFSRGADAKVPSMEFVEFVAPIHAPRTLPLVTLQEEQQQRRKFLMQKTKKFHSAVLLLATLLLVWYPFNRHISRRHFRPSLLRRPLPSKHHF